MDLKIGKQRVFDVLKVRTKKSRTYGKWNY
jgi:hypothetical protein